MKNTVPIRPAFFFRGTRGEVGLTPVEQAEPRTPIQKTMGKDQTLNSQAMVKKFITLQVQDYVDFIPALLNIFRIKVSNFKAGRLSSYLEQWKLLTSDEFILDMVLGGHIELSSPPTQAN